MGSYRVGVGVLLGLSVLAACADDDAEPWPDAAVAPVRDAAAVIDAAPPEPTPWRDCGCDAGVPAGELMGLTHGPVLGAVTDRSIKVWARGDRAGSFFVRLWPNDDPEDERCSAPVAVDPRLDLTGVARLEGLTPSTTYGYRIEAVSENECSVAISDDATFRTLSKEGEPTHIRFAVGGDVRGTVFDAADEVVLERMSVPGFTDVEEVAPDFMLMVGDNVYADDDGFVQGDFDGQLRRGRKLYHDVWGSRQFRSLFSHVPVFMMWDDHELMDNYWRGRNDFVYEVGRTLFDSYQGSQNPDPIVPGELYYSFRAGDVGFFVLDPRTHRDGNMEPDDADKSMLGAAQRQAFEEWLAQDDSNVHVIVSPVIVSTFSTTGADAWRSFKVERDALLEVLADHGTKHTFIISGDQHWSAILHMEAGEDSPYTLYEFQTTPLASGTRFAPDKVNEHVIALDRWHQVFGVFDIDTHVDPPALDFTLCAVGEPCAVHMEPPPTQLDVSEATVPYSIFFEGSERGFELLPSE
jgi:alkaline phosphatase D